MWHSVPGRVRAICACCELPAQANLGGQDLRRAQDRARWITGGCNRKLTQGRQAQIRNTSARNLRLAVCYPLATATPILPCPVRGEGRGNISDRPGRRPRQTQIKRTKQVRNHRRPHYVPSLAAELEFGGRIGRRRSRYMRPARGVFVGVLLFLGAGASAMFGKRTTAEFLQVLPEHLDEDTKPFYDLLVSEIKFKDIEDVLQDLKEARLFGKKRDRQTGFFVCAGSRRSTRAE